ncbi:MAG: 6,7-dimethyl-8-ribityllumazine synthase [Acidimicrobiales bacterium]|nr:6,7-dimethyl-8-ribityllumazine synthase [Actinomycetota bacterium]
MEGAGLRVAVVASRFNTDVTGRLLNGAVEGLTSHGVDLESVAVVWVPGAFEVPLAAHRLASSGEFDAVVCVGAVIRGDTDHYTHIATQCAAGVQRVQLDTGVPVMFGVLTTDNVQDALDRAGGELGNKGFEAATAALEMADLLRQLPKRAFTGADPC